MLTDEELNALTTLAASAQETSPGPWRTITDAPVDDDESAGISDANGKDVVVTDTGYYPPAANVAAFMAAADPVTVVLLAKEVRLLRAVLVAAETVCLANDWDMTAPGELERQLVDAITDARADDVVGSADEASQDPGESTSTKEED